MKTPNAGSSIGKTAGLESSLKMTRKKRGSIPRPATIKDVMDAAIKAGLTPRQLMKVAEQVADNLSNAESQ